MRQVRPTFALRLKQALELSPAVIREATWADWLIEHLRDRFGVQVGRGEVASWLAGEEQPSDSLADRLSELLEVDTDWFKMGG